MRIRRASEGAEQNRQEAYFSFDNTGMYCQNVSPAPEKRRITDETGSPFFWLLLFGEANKSDSPAGEKIYLTKNNLLQS